MSGENKEKYNEVDEEYINIQEILFSYLVHLTWFVVSVVA